MATSQLVENKRYPYEVFEQKHDMECTTCRHSMRWHVASLQVHYLPPLHAMACGLFPPVVPSPPAWTLRVWQSPHRKPPVGILRTVIAGRPSAPPPPSLWSSRPVSLDHHPVRNGGVLDDDHNAVADVSVIPSHLARPITRSAFTALFSGVPIARSDPARFACRSVP